MEKISPLNNYVLIEPDISYSGYKMSNGVTLDINSYFQEEKHAIIKGKVISVPKKLIYDRNNPSTLQWNTKMELEIGDTCYYHYLSYINANNKRDPRAIMVGGKKYIFVRYDKIYAAERKNRVVPINGHALIEPIRKESKIGLEFSSRHKTHSVILGRVKYLGEPNLGHRDSKKDVPDDDSIKVGDIVVMDKACDIPLEYSFKKSVGDGETLFRVERRLLLAVKS